MRARVKPLLKRELVKPETTRSCAIVAVASCGVRMGSMIAVALFGLFSTGIFLAHAVDAYHAQQKWEA
jgi:hypothetical protein